MKYWLALYNQEAGSSPLNRGKSILTLLDKFERGRDMVCDAGVLGVWDEDFKDAICCLYSSASVSFCKAKLMAFNCCVLAFNCWVLVFNCCVFAFNWWLISCNEWAWWLVVVLSKDKDSLIWEEDLVSVIVLGT